MKNYINCFKIKKFEPGGIMQLITELENMKKSNPDEFSPENQQKLNLLYLRANNIGQTTESFMYQNSVPSLSILGNNTPISDNIASPDKAPTLTVTDSSAPADLSTDSKLKLIGELAKNKPKTDYLVQLQQELDEIKRKETGGKWLNGISQGVAGAADAADKVFLGDKNFDTGSQLLDAGVDTVSGALLASENGYAMAAGALLKVGNFATKALGQTVPGFNVNTGSGYGTMGSFQEHSGRVWDNVSGLLNRRNQEAQLALNAAEINNDIKFEQEARMNSVENTIRLNNIALAGGMDTSVLAAKRGAKLNRLSHFKDKPKTQVAKAENGMKLKKVEVSEELSLMPVGSMHKNLNHLDLEDITPKGIPVLQVKEGTDTDKIETKEQVEKVDYMQSAEIESEEIIFSKELTDFIEEKREEWNKTKDSELCKEVGMRLCKEILMNTKDENEVIKKIEEHVED